MRRRLALHIAALLSLSANSIAATVEYQHPGLTIVASAEPLEAVLRSLGKEMRIYITVPTGFNPVVSCDIQHQPVKQAFKSLLGDLSYSLEWEEGGERLVGLTILAAGDTPAATTVSDRSTNSQSVDQAAPLPVTATDDQSAGIPVFPVEHGAPVPDHDAAMAEQEARMAEEREAHEAEMALRLQEEEIAHEARMKEEVERHDAEAAAYLESQGIQ